MFTMSHVVVDSRPEMKPWMALICVYCGDFKIYKDGQTAMSLSCVCGKIRDRIHDLSQPCKVCLKASNYARDNRTVKV